jgi:hypothetical protein
MWLDVPSWQPTLWVGPNRNKTSDIAEGLRGNEVIQMSLKLNFTAEAASYAKYDYTHHSANKMSH